MRPITLVYPGHAQKQGDHPQQAEGNVAQPDFSDESAGCKVDSFSLHASIRELQWVSRELIDRSRSEVLGDDANDFSGAERLGQQVAESEFLL